MQNQAGGPGDPSLRLKNGCSRDDPIEGRANENHTEPLPIAGEALLLQPQQPVKHTLRSLFKHQPPLHVPHIAFEITQQSKNATGQGRKTKSETDEKELRLGAPYQFFADHFPDPFLERGECRFVVKSRAEFIFRQIVRMDAEARIVNSR